MITPDLDSHIVTYAAPGDDGLVYTSSGGGPLRRSNFCRRVWHPALREAGLPLATGSLTGQSRLHTACRGHTERHRQVPNDCRLGTCRWTPPCVIGLVVNLIIR